jgi:hypothetical protein
VRSTRCIAPDVGYIARYDRARLRPLAARPQMRQTRVRRGVAQTPIARYRHPATGRTVTIVTTVHFGTAKYFNALNDIIAGLAADGAVICYEGVTSATQEQWAAASDAERAVRSVYQSAFDRGRQELCQALGWIDQNTGLRYSPGWRNVDTTDLNVIRQAQPDAISYVAEGSSDLFDGLTPEQTRVVMASFVALLERLLSADYFDLIGRWSTREVPGDGYRALSRALVGEREWGALAGLPPDADAVLLWGTGHLRGLAAGLRKAGYRHRGTSWVSVGRLPALWPSLRVVVCWLRAPDKVGRPRSR